MSREIVILRHAQAEPHETRDDFARRLTAKGRGECAAVREHFAQQRVAFDRVLCSPAARALETARAVLGDDARIDEVPAIYEATPGTLIDVLEQALASPRVLLVGHNPGLEQLVALLVEGRSEDFRGLPTAGVARLTLPADTALEPGIARLADFWSP
jgi:phosphohistidine phosphatase SixA